MLALEVHRMRLVRPVELSIDAVRMVERIVIQESHRAFDSSTNSPARS